ncbi:hypothetical protein EON65_03345 [archaeon]|nr:MAG: hypothetical protein EON65_03345 [archaeon]
MSFPWKDLNNQLKDIWQQHAVTVFPSMVRQGVSTTIYGLACMQADWSDLHPDFQDVFQKQVIHCLHIPNLRSQLRVSQVISNIFYGLGKCKAPWQSLTTECRQTLLDAILTCSEEFGGHEVGNIAYGLGGMIAPFQELPPAIFDTLAAVMDRVAEDISQTELCSILHGLVNIDASWSRMTERFKTALINIIRSQAKLDYICLACITYCMGKYGAMWRDLPKVLCATLEKELALSNSLADQTLSNTIYGMGLMNVRWDDLPDVVRVSLFQVLGSSDAFASFKPQHISNTLWGLARMETIWSDLPTHNLEDAMNRMLSAASAQELANAIFGLGGLETTWSILQLPTIQTLAQAIESCYLRMNTQVLDSHIMF